MTENPKPWTAQQIQEAYRLRRLGCTLKMVAQGIGVSQERVERLFGVGEYEDAR